MDIQEARSHLKSARFMLIVENDFDELWYNKDASVRCQIIVDKNEISPYDPIDWTVACAWPLIVLYHGDDGALFYAAAGVDRDISDELFIFEDYGSDYKAGGRLVSNVSEAFSVFESIVSKGGALERYGWERVD